ncbi:hypothetical protein C3E99_16400 [Sphingopyxis sp. MG]|uniref:Secreted protein n=2 Tax=Sphingomonadaceae TaxID=41297 RepID=A0AA86L4T1_9SPHN|nr:Uncharacterized protein SGRAN_3997 [Sphingopyxis granuli]AVA15222.1 hypothetical protein C3E99_16400 [Sphingopyxis sp. MG]
MRMTPPAIAALLALISSGIPSVFAMEQPAPAVAAAASPYSYADLADLAVAAPMAIHARIRKAAALKPEQAPGLAAGHVRFFIEADVVSLIRGSGPLAARISYLVDLPLAANGKAPKLKSKQPVLIFARPVASGTTTDTGSVRLVAPDAQLAWDPATEARLRAILTELVKPGAPPAITGIANGFHVPGTLPGEGETQLFLNTATGDPVSLTVITAADGSRRWAAAFGEIVDGSAAVPRRDTLAWYRLACGLPKALPLDKLAGTAPEDRKKAAADYAMILGALGECTRTRAPVGG